MGLGQAGIYNMVANILRASCGISVNYEKAKAQEKQECFTEKESILKEPLSSGLFVYTISVWKKKLL